MHVHLSYARASALPALVANGVTSVRDMGSQLSELDDWRSQIATGSLLGPQIVRAGPMLNGQQFNRYQVPVSSDAEARAAVRTLHNVGVDFVKVHRAMNREAYFAVAQETKRLSIPFVGHIPNTVTPAEASDAGQATVEHAETLFEGTFAAANKGRNLAQAITEWRTTAARDLFAKFVMNGTAMTPTLVAQRQALDWLESRTANDPRSKYVAASVKRETAQALDPRSDTAPVGLDRSEIVRVLPVTTHLHVIQGDDRRLQALADFDDEACSAQRGCRRALVVTTDHVQPPGRHLTVASSSSPTTSSFTLTRHKAVPRRATAVA